MPLPIILGVGAAIAGAAGVGTGIHGAAKMKEANDTMKLAESFHENNIKYFEKKSASTNKTMDVLGNLELDILKGFEEFSDTIEKIQNRPQFKQYNKDGVTLPKYNKEELKNVSVGAGVLLGGLGGAAAGTAGGFAAAGATSAAVMALGTASTGTAIISLSGAALTNATLAALGGGAIAAGGGGIALGTTILGATTLGVGLLVGGVIFNFTGSKLSDKADEAYSQMKKAEDTINKVCNYLTDLEKTATKYTNSLITVREKYLENFNFISYLINKLDKVDWNDFTEQEKKTTENTVLLVGLLYKMCQVSLVYKSENESDMNTINKDAVDEAISNSEQILKLFKEKDKECDSKYNENSQEELDLSKYDERGFEKNTVKHRNGTLFDEYGYSKFGYDKNGNRINITKHYYEDDNGKVTYHEFIKNEDDNCNNQEEIDLSKYDDYGYDINGFNSNGYNKRGFNVDGYHKNGTKYDDEGFNYYGFNEYGEAIRI